MSDRPRPLEPPAHRFIWLLGALLLLVFLYPVKLPADPFAARLGTL